MNFPRRKYVILTDSFHFDLYLLNIYLNLENGDVRNLDQTRKN